jgi:hypothetical protein
MTRTAGSQHGKAWEQVIERRARSNGLLILKHELTGRYVGGGGAKLIKSELDFSLLNRDGRLAVFDAKTYDEDHFDYSALLSRKPPYTHQIDRALMYRDWGVNAGFLVWHRSIDHVVFYSGHTIAGFGPGTRFRPNMGFGLGNVSDFGLRGLLVV